MDPFLSDSPGKKDYGKSQKDGDYGLFPWEHTIAYIYHKLDRKYEISEIIRQIEEFDFNDEIGFLYATFNLCEATNFFEKLAQSNTKEEK